MKSASVIIALALGLTMLPSPAQAGDVSIGINIGPPPPPPVVVAAPPALVVVPGSPVYYAPGLSVDLFAYGGRYYRFHDGAWFAAATYGGPWTFVAVNSVPAPVLAVPVAYYKVPPGHMKHGRGPWHKRD